MRKKKGSEHRLPVHVRPIRYAITIEPDLDEFTFTGNETIDIESDRAASSITLHSAEIEILSAEFRKGKAVFEGAVSYQDKEERATILFPKKLPKGKGMLALSFTGILNDKMRGFYRSRYEHEGKTHHMAVTQFESTDARRAFPCFDEPAHKAVFEVSLIVPEDRTVISNTLETEIAEHRAGYKVVKFAPSPRMSSYLLAFIVGHFDKIEAKTKDGTLVRVFTTPGKKHQAAFALECGVKCIEFYEKYFGITYPLPAMDLIAIPDFAAGAMENWGAVTYRETAILVDPEHSAVQNRQRVALVIAHELAHQWFGNLVTMEWWTHLWLNEGFATYMEYVAIDNVFPEWDIWNDFLLAEHSRALSLDALANTHAIEIDVRHPQEISEIFDTISYAKGASVIRMLAEYLGEKAFIRGLRAYLKKHSYDNAETTDLWRALERASGKPVQKMMDVWTRKPGYPLIDVQETGSKISFEQRRFLSGEKTGQRTVWDVPLHILSGKKKSSLLLKSKKTLVPKERERFLKGNLGETSFVRARYTPEHMELLAKEIRNGNELLGTADRFGLIRDTFAFVQSGLLPTDELLRFVRAYAGETQYIVWAQIIEQMFSLRGLLFGKPEFEKFCQYARTLFVPAISRIGWEKKEGESYEQPFLRSALIMAAGTFGDEETIKKAQTLFWEEESGKGTLPSDLRATVYSLVAQNGGQKEYAALEARFRKATLEEEKDRLLRALASFRDPQLVQKTLDTAFSEGARGQDTLKAVGFSFANPYGRTVAWKHLTKHWAYIVQRFAGGHLFSRFAAGTANFTSKTDATDIERFFKTHASEGIGRTVAQAVEQIRSHAAWYGRDGKKIGAFLASENR